MSTRDVIEDRAYFIRRSREERAAAAIAEDNAAALAHLNMAEAYDRRAETVGASFASTSPPAHETAKPTPA